MVTMPNPSRKDSQREVLERFIALYKSAAFHEDELTDYIQAFSAYLNLTDPAYYYNYSFLVQQTVEFRDFLTKAVAKERVLTDFFARLKRQPRFQSLLGGVGTAGSIEVSLNNFWRIDPQSEACSLVEDFSIGGAVCAASGDRVMVRRGDSVFRFSPAVDERYLEQVAALLSGADSERGDCNG